ncbi:conserved hypothetical protein, partial [Ricinus communis]
MTVRDQVGDGTAEVPQEAVAGLGAIDHAPAQHRQPRQGIIAAALAEFGQHVGGPVLLVGFPAVQHQVAQALGAGHLAEIRFEVRGDGGAIQLVHFQADALLGGRIVGLAGERVAQAQYGPAACRNVPIKAAIGAQLAGQVDHGLAAYRHVGGDGRRGQALQFFGNREASFVFVAVYAAGGGDREFGDIVRSLARLAHHIVEEVTRR